MIDTLTAGFLPLTDAAPLVVAREMGFAAEEGIDLHLQRAPSWSALRDKLSFGHLDAAHMLSPVPVATALGLGGGGVGLAAGGGGGINIGGTTVVVPETEIDVREQEQRFTILDGSVSLQEMVDGLNAIGVGARQTIAILQAIKAAGALHADLEII